MNHAPDSLLLAYSDGQIDGAAEAALRDHLAACAECAAELDGLRGMSGQLHEALAVLDVPAPTLRTRAALAAHGPVGSPTRVSRRPGAWGRIGSWGLAKAAALLLVLGGAVAAAIPGSPVRRAIESTLARLLEREPAVVRVEQPALPEEVHESVWVDAGERLTVLLHGVDEVDITVRLVDGTQANVSTAGLPQEVRFRRGTGRIEMSGFERGAITVSIPRQVADARIEIDGTLHVLKRDGLLQLTGPAGRERGDEVTFQIRR